MSETPIVVGQDGVPYVAIDAVLTGIQKLIELQHHAEQIDPEYAVLKPGMYEMGGQLVNVLLALKENYAHNADLSKEVDDLIGGITEFLDNEE